MMLHEKIVGVCTLPWKHIFCNSDVILLQFFCLPEKLHQTIRSLLPFSTIFLLTTIASGTSPQNYKNLQHGNCSVRNIAECTGLRTSDAEQQREVVLQNRKCNGESLAHHACVRENCDRFAHIICSRCLAT